jgi:hypothetical protein
MSSCYAIAGSIGKDVAKLWDMASGKSHSSERMSKPGSEERDASSWQRAGDAPTAPPSQHQALTDFVKAGCTTTLPDVRFTITTVVGM